MLAPRRALPVLAACAFMVAVLAPGTTVAAGPSAGATSSVSPSSAAGGPEAYTVSTVAGNGDHEVYGDGGPAAAAGLGHPERMAIGPDGTVYVAGDHRVRAVDPRTHRISTVAGSGRSEPSDRGGPATAAGFGHIRGIAVGPDGTLYVADDEVDRVRAVDPRTHRVRTVVGTFDAVPLARTGKATRLDIEPTAITVDDRGDLYVADRSKNAVVRVRPSTGRYTLVLHGSDGPAPLVDRFVEPEQIAAGPHGVLYVNGTYDQHGQPRWGVAAFDLHRGTVRTVVPSVTCTGERVASEFNEVTVGRDGTVYEMCRRPVRGTDLLTYGLLAVDPHRPGRPRYLAGQHTSRDVLGDGGPADRADLGRLESDDVDGLAGNDVAAAPDGTVYVLDATHDRVRAVRPGRPAPARTARSDATVVTVTGHGHVEGDGPKAGGPTENTLDSPADVALDGATVYVADSGVVLAVDRTTGRTRVVAGGGETTPTVEGTQRATDVRLDATGVAVGPDHRLYVVGVEDDLFRVDLDAGTVAVVTGVQGAKDVTVTPRGDAYVVGDEGIFVVRRRHQDAERISATQAVAATTGRDGTVYVVNGFQVRRVDPRSHRLVPVAGWAEGGTSHAASTGDGGPALSATFRYLIGVAAAPDGTLYLVDGNRIRAVDPRTGVIGTVAGATGGGRRGDGGPAARARFARPAAVAAGPHGAVYIADTGNHRLRALGVPAPHDDRPVVMAVVVVLVVVLVLVGAAVLVLPAVRRRRRRATGARSDPAPPAEDASEDAPAAPAGPPATDRSTPGRDPAAKDGGSPPT